MTRLAIALPLFALSLLWTSSSAAHCQIPCGIYDDELRVQLIEENITTVEKSMNQIIALSAEDDEDYNQIVRWVVNKEKHAEELARICTAENGKTLKESHAEIQSGYTRAIFNAESIESRS
mgnify:CR=1 FL=1